MALDIEINQKGLFKKELILSDITGGKYKYGVLDSAWRLDEGSLDGETIIFYDPLHIGRGVEFEGKSGIKDKLKLRMPLPATIYDIDMLFDIVKRVAKKWNAKTFIQDDVPCDIKDVDDIVMQHKQMSHSWLAGIKNSLNDSETSIMFCVMWPLELRTDTLSEFGRNKDAEGFASYLHRLQAVDLYYAAPRIYKLNDKEYFGAYAITATTGSIIPITPSAPTLAVDPNTGGPLECSKYVVSLVSIQDNGVIGRISYEDFAEAVQVDSLTRFDETHVVLELSEESIHEIARNYPDPLEG